MDLQVVTILDFSLAHPPTHCRRLYLMPAYIHIHSYILKGVHTCCRWLLKGKKSTTIP